MRSTTSGEKQGNISAHRYLFMAVCLGLFTVAHNPVAPATFEAVDPFLNEACNIEHIHGKKPPQEAMCIHNQRCGKAQESILCATEALDVNIEKDRFTEDRGFTGRGWICDKCGLVIEKASDGWVQWREYGAESKTSKVRGERALGRDLQLVHAGSASPLPIKAGEMYGCQFDDDDPAYMTMDLSLPEFLGPDGLLHLLDFIAKSSVETSEVLEMIKRLNLPGYEQTRIIGNPILILGA